MSLKSKSLGHSSRILDSESEDETPIFIDEVIEDHAGTEEENDQIEVIEAENNENEGNNSDDNENESRRVVKPKRIVRNPQPKLNEQTIKGPRGIQTLEKYFDRVKFKGKGHEAEDLNVVLKTYEYWCHRLFPKFPFDNCIARLEKLGTKKTTQTHIKRIRMGLLFEEQDNVPSDNENKVEEDGFVDTFHQSNEFNNLVASSSADVELSEEQVQRMRENKEIAERLKQERLQKIREKKKVNLTESNRLDQVNLQDGGDFLSQDIFVESGLTSRSQEIDVLAIENKHISEKKGKKLCKQVIESDSEAESEDHNKSPPRNLLVSSDDEIKENTEQTCNFEDASILICDQKREEIFNNKHNIKEIDSISLSDIEMNETDEEEINLQNKAKSLDSNLLNKMQTEEHNDITQKKEKFNKIADRDVETNISESSELNINNFKTNNKKKRNKTRIKRMQISSSGEASE